MGLSRDFMIERAGKFLISELSDRAGSLRFSEIYEADGCEVLQRRLHEACDGEAMMHCDFHLIDLASIQLDEQGILAIRELGTETSDGLPDYEMELTTDGQIRLSSGYTPTYRHME